jgi:hypothetical protein
MPSYLRAEYEDIPLRQERARKEMHWTLTSEFCLLHPQLTRLIPLGIHAGWPKTIDARQLAQRLFTLSSTSRGYIQWKGVKFYAKACRQLQKKGSQQWRSDMEQ